MIMKQYCVDCENKPYCEITPEECPIAKENKCIADFKKAKEEIRNVVKEAFIEYFGGVFK